MSFEHNEIYPCALCNKNVINDAIKCDLCGFWVHRTCAKMTKKQLMLKSNPLYYYYCENCSQVFPFMKINDDDLIYMCFKDVINENIFNVYKAFKDTSFQNRDAEFDDLYLNPDKLYNGNSSTDCKYFLDEDFKTVISSLDGLSLIHFNARSMKANFEHIKKYIKELNKVFHVIAISETWFESIKQSEQFCLENYTMFSTTRTEKKGGGVTLYTHDNLKVKQIESSSREINGILESITVELHIEKGKNIVVSCIYRTPGSNINTFSEYLDNFLYNEKNKSVYIIGDTNIDLMKYDDHVPTKDFLDMLYSYGVFPKVDKPTRITAVSTTLIDNIFTNVISSNAKCGVLCNDISDHLPIFYVAEYRGITKVTKKVFKVVRRCNAENIEQFRNQLQQQSWDHVMGEINVNNAYNNFIDIIKKLYSDACPQVRVKVNSTNVHKPWFTNGLKNACKKKNSLYGVFLKTKLKIHEAKYKRYKNKLTSILRYCEKKYFSDLLEQNKNNIKATWSILNTIMNKKVSINTLPNDFEDTDGGKIKGKQNIANGFNDFFVNVGPNLANNIQCENNKTIHSYLKKRNDSSMFLGPVDVNEVLKTVNSCNSKTSTDCDEMSMSLVKNIIYDVITPFTYICNLSFEKSVFPDKMKVAKVVPLYKSGSHNHFTNYRPVSLLPQFSKVLEKLFDVRLQKFIEKYSVLHDSQYGFRSNRSTSLALMELIEEICTEIDNKNITIGVFIDLKKAFDTIDHKLLLQKLEFYGVRGAANDWVKSYLSCRKQFVQVDEHASKLLDIICGVPQGSVLGPKLFILYINDLCNVSNLVKYVLFADDTNIFKSGKNIHDLSKEISNEMDKLNVWFNVNKLSLNVAKTHFMVFGKVKHSGSINIIINDSEIERVSVTKFLGVFIDEKLNWSEHIIKVQSKLSKCVSIIYKARELVSKDALVILYNSWFLPHLSYCCEVWANTYKTNLHKIVILQKKGYENNT